jgi:hypothetical protein
MENRIYADGFQHSWDEEVGVSRISFGEDMKTGYLFLVRTEQIFSVHQHCRHSHCSFRGATYPKAALVGLHWGKK